MEITPVTLLRNNCPLGKSDQAEKGPNYALMAFLSTSSDSKVSNDFTCSKSCLEIVNYLKSQNEQLFKDLKKTEFMVLGYKIGNFMPLTPDLSFTGINEFANKPVAENTKSSERETKAVWKNDDALIIKEWVSENEEENVTQPKIKKKTVRPNIVKKEFVKPRQQEKTARKIVKKVKHNRQNTRRPRGNKKNWNNMMSQKLGSNFEMFNKDCYECGSFDHLQVNAAHSKTTVNAARSMSYLSKIAHLTVKRPIHKSTTFKNSSVNQKVNTVKGNNFNTARPKAVVNVVKGNNLNAIKASACTKASDNAGQAKKETEPIKDYILLPLWTTDLPFYQDLKGSQDDGSKPSSDDGKKVDEDPRKENECNDQEKKDNVNNTNNVNTISSNVNAASTNKDNELPFDPNMPDLKDVSTFNFSSDDEDDGAMDDMNNLDTTIQVDAREISDEFFGELTFFLGLKKDGIFISQDKYVAKILKKFGFTEVNSASTSMETQKPRLTDEDGKEVDVHMYRSMIGSLMYLTSLRPDIMFAVCACARYQVNPK
nr:hypothetical protein [Tanacetum cinerariifolium]